MKNLLIALMLVSSCAVAEIKQETIRRTVLCGPMQEIHAGLSDKFFIALRGTSGTTIGGESAEMFFYSNNETGEYVFVVGNHRNACVLEDGRIYPANRRVVNT